MLTHIHNTEALYWSEIADITNAGQLLSPGTHTITLNGETYTITNEPL
jgi:hypothetical protein